MTATIFKTYIPIYDNEDNTHLKIIMYYEPDREKRGYYITIFPVKCEEKDGYCLESFTCYSGIKTCVLPVTRKSTKSEGISREFVRKNLDKYINNHFSDFKLAEHSCSALGI